MIRQSTLDALRRSALDPEAVVRIVTTALTEDLGPRRLDVTSVATIPADQTDTADLVARADGVVAGLAVAAAVFEEASGGTLDVSISVADGDAVAAATCSRR